MSTNKAPSGAGLAVAASEAVFQLARGPKTFLSLLRSIRCPSHSVMVAALAELTADGLIEQVNSKFSLTARGRDLVTACRPGRRKAA